MPNGPTNPLGFSTLGTPTWPLAKVLRSAQTWGCTCIELRLLDGDIVTPETAPEAIRAAAATIAASGISLCTLASSIRLIDTAKAAADLPRMIEIAGRLGARQLRVFSGPESGAGLSEDIRRAADVVNGAIELTRTQDVGVALETHHALSGAGPTADLLAMVPDPRFGVIWDPVYTWLAGDTVAEAWRLLGARTIEMQVKDVVRLDGDKFTPKLLGEGDAPWQAALARGLGGGFAGPIIVEWEKHWHPEIAEPDVAIPQHLAAIRRLLAAIS